MSHRSKVLKWRKWKAFWGLVDFFNWFNRWQKIYDVIQPKEKGNKQFLWEIQEKSCFSYSIDPELIYIESNCWIAKLLRFVGALKYLVTCVFLLFCFFFKLLLLISLLLLFLLLSLLLLLLLLLSLLLLLLLLLLSLYFYYYYHHYH